jgi:hypothetical protein
MKLRALRHFGDTNTIRNLGDVYEEPVEAVAEARIKAGLAEKAGESTKVTETATADTAGVETATLEGKGKKVKKPR